MVVVSHLFLFLRKSFRGRFDSCESNLPLFGTIYFPTAPHFMTSLNLSYVCDAFWHLHNGNIWLVIIQQNLCNFFTKIFHKFYSFYSFFMYQTIQLTISSKRIYNLILVLELFFTTSHHSGKWKSPLFYTMA